MRPDLPWNVAGISSEAREAARAAARREGLSVGEWLTRRIVAGLSDASYASTADTGFADFQEFAGMSGARQEWPSRTEFRAEPDRQRRDSDAMLDRVSRSEADTAEVYRRIEDQLRNMARRLDSSERSQTESNRVVSKAAVEMNIAAREQAQAFDQLGAHVSSLTDRLSRVEGRDSGDGLRDAVKALHQGLSRLADQITETANQSAVQISNLANNIETVAGRVGQSRADALAATQALETRLATLDERVRAVEAAAQAQAGSLNRALDSIEAQKHAPSPMEAIVRLEDSVHRLEERGSDPGIDRRLMGIERAISEVRGRIEEQDEPSPLEENLKKVMARLEALEVSQREAAAEARKAAVEKQTLSDDLPAQLVAPLPPQPAAPPVQAFVPPFVPPPAAVAPPTAAAFGPLPGFEPPPFAAPPFAQAPQPGFADPLPNYEMPPEAFAAGAAEAPPTVESYLAAARRSARVAAQQETERSASLGNLRWGAAAKVKETQAPRTRPLVVGLVALIAIAVIAGAILSRTASHSPQVINLLPKPTATTPVPSMATPVAPPSETPPAPGLHSSTQEPGVAPAPLPVKPHAAPTGLAAAKPATQVAALPPQQLPPAAVQPTGRAPLDRLTQAANSGNAKAELIVGLKYLDGDGVPANEAEAAKWLTKAAEAGEPVAEYRLGTLYERGRGVPADAAKAARWYQAAANLGSRKAMHNLAVAYAEGAGMKKDYTEASRWFLKAANLGLSDSQFNLAVLYERGLGVPQNLVDAFKWYAIAAAQGDAESKSRLTAISSQLDNEARGAAQHAADSFRPGQLDARANVAPTISDVTRG